MGALPKRELQLPGALSTNSLPTDNFSRGQYKHIFDHLDVHLVYRAAPNTKTRIVKMSSTPVKVSSPTNSRLQIFSANQSKAHAEEEVVADFSQSKPPYEPKSPSNISEASEEIGTVPETKSTSRTLEFSEEIRNGKTQSMSVATSVCGSGINTPSTPMPSSPKPAGIETPVAAQASSPLAIDTPKASPIPQSPAPIKEPKTFLALACVTNFTKTDTDSFCHTGETCVVTLNTDMDPTQVGQAIREAQDKEPGILGQARAVWNKNIVLYGTQLTGTTELRESNVKDVLTGLMKAAFAEVLVDIFIYHDERTEKSINNR
ncbi:hypothetical protein HYALB_00009987 [Hymenoscyphus albidus]|uniref:Uncharacterized protein n=1 Tax=Hymenoscyphus albidus TaxID=595503 RepID=A0A9N9LXJ8_9HELO|nr:hypothetical protein HYALB_00009987 [Hymenoscyphus albidus]